MGRGSGRVRDDDRRSKGPETGVQGGRYQVIEMRRGGMGVVYLCRDRETERPVAIKTFAPEYLGNPGARLRFLQEAGNWIALGRHPHIVRAYRVEQIGQPPQPHVVVDWIVPARGAGDPSLAARLKKRRPLPFGRSLRYALHIARGMRHAHSRIPGLVHRDLKPGNVLIGDDDLARVTDFGLARSYQGIEVRQWRAERAGYGDGARAAGTAPYCAPEQWDIAAVLDQGADIYSLGCILYELLTGLPAAAGANDELRDVHLQGRLNPIPIELPDTIARIIRRCTALEPEQRYRDWIALERALAAAHEEVMGAAAPPAPLDAAADAGDAGDRIGTYRALGRSYFDLGQWHPARACLEHAAELARRQGGAAPEAGALHDLGYVAAETDRLTEAARLLQRALARARRAGAPLLQADVLSTLGIVHARLGQPGRGHRALRRALSLARRSGNRDAEVTALGNLGNAYAESREPRRAVECFEQLRARLQEAGSADPVTEQRTLSNLGAALLEIRAPERAIPHLERARALAGEHGDLAGGLRALHGLCEALAACGNRERLVEQAESYLRLARKHGGQAEEGHARRFLDAARDSDPRQ